MSWVHALNAWHVFEVVPIILLLDRPSSSRSAFITLALLLIFTFSPWFKSAQILYQQRNFYGIKQVISQSGARAYYASVLPVVKTLQTVNQPLRAMIVGLGTGIMACQFRAKDRLSMVEID